MVDAIVSLVIEKLAETTQNEMQKEVALVRGVKKKLLYISNELNAIRDVLHDAEKRGYKEETVRGWLNKLEDVSYDVDDVVDEWNFANLKLEIEGSDDFVEPDKHDVCSCLSFKKVTTRRDITKKVEEIKGRIDMIVKEKDRYDFIVDRPAGHDPRECARVGFTSTADVSKIHGRDADKDILVRKLIVDEERLETRVVSIVGVGGIGKTTLAQLAYTDGRVVDRFNLRIWVRVSDVFDVVRIAKGILEIVNKEGSTDLNELDAVLDCLANSISGKKFLLVLDDVWNEDFAEWEPLKNSLKSGCAAGSTILVTTRSERVARTMGTTQVHRLDRLSHTDCWLLMRNIAFSGRSEEGLEELQDIGKVIAEKCKGLPLAAKIMGSLLLFKDTIEEWENVLDNEIWQLEEAEVELFPHLFMSYNELSPPMKRCFSYCSIFPKDSEMDVEKLIRMWMALGYLGSSGSSVDLELKGKEYCDNLKMRSFFRDVTKSDDTVLCKMHNIVHDFALFLMKTKSHHSEDPDGRVEVSKNVSSKARDPSLVWHIKAYRSLICPKMLPLHVFKLATCLRELSLCRCGLEEIPNEIGNLIQLRYLDLSNNKLVGESLLTICKSYNLQTLYVSSCLLKDIPRQIGNLINLRQLDLSSNKWLVQLPETIYSLYNLRTLDITSCGNLSILPEGIHRLVNLRHLPNAHSRMEIPQGFDQLTGIQTLRIFDGGRSKNNKLGYLNKLDQLTGSLELKVCLHDAEDVVIAQKAELRNKTNLLTLNIHFSNKVGRTNEDDSVRNEVMEALKPPPNLRSLIIIDYQGTKFPSWIMASSSLVLNHLRVLRIEKFDNCSTLPPLGKLPCLEELSVEGMGGLQVLSREFLGIDVEPVMLSGTVIAFPKLKELTFVYCNNWEEWEDIPADEDNEDGVDVIILPCLKELKIDDCRGLTSLPHALLRKATSLEHLKILDCFRLSELYEDKNGAGWRSLSHIPNVKVHYWKEKMFYTTREGPIPFFG